jgi:hypothetical protein
LSCVHKHHIASTLTLKYTSGFMLTRFQSMTAIEELVSHGYIKDIDPVQNIDITRSYVRAFFDQYLNNEPQSLLDGPSADFPEVKFNQVYTRKRM